MINERKGLPEFVANITDNIIIEVTKSGNVLFFNDKAACIFIGISKCNSLLKILNKEDALILKRNFDTAFYHQYPHHFYHKIKGRFYLIYMYPFDASIWISMFDITEKRQQAHLLYVNTQRIKFSESNIKFGYWELDTVLKRFYWSEGMYNIFGLPNVDQIYKKNLIKKLIHPEDIDIYKQKLRELIEKGHNVEGKIRIITLNNDLKYCHFVAGILYESGDTKIVGVFKDITEETQNALKLIKEKDDVDLTRSYFLAQVSHDIRQPLQMIEMLSSSFENASIVEHSEIINNISKLTKRALEMLDNMMKISQIDLGRIVFHPQKIDLKDLLKAICDDYKMIANRNKINLRCRLINADIYQDNILLVRVIINLLSNAFKYAKSKIVVGNSSNSFWVIDDGCGIANDKLDRIFEEFYQGIKTDNIFSNGVGLGLNIISKIIDVIGAKIKVRSVYGKYSAFVVYL